MKKIAILILSILVAGLFVACNQDITVDAQTYANMEVGTFVLNGQNYATLQAAVDAIGSKAAGDNVIRLTKNASGPGAKIANKDVTIDFQGYTYSFTNVNGLQGQDVTGKDFGLSITTGSDVVLKGLQKIDLNDKTTTDLTMVYVEGATTSLTIEDAPKMEVANSQYVFWAANGATLTIGSTSETAATPTTITGKIAATGGTEQTSKPVVTFNNNTKIEASELKADSAVVVINTSAASTIDSFVGSNEAVIVVSGTGDVTVEKNDSDNEASYEIQNTSSDATVDITDDGTGHPQQIDSGEAIVVDGGDVTPGESTYVASIGNKLYETLNAAWVDACFEGATITVLTNLSNEVTQELPYGTLGANGFAIDKEVDVVLDLNGYTLTFYYENLILPLNNRAFTVENKGSLIVNGGGTIDTKGTKVQGATASTAASGTGYYGAFRAEVGTELYLENITLKNYRPWGLNVKLCGASAELNNVKITSEWGGGIEVTSDNLANPTVFGYAKLTDCTMTQSKYYDWCSVPVSVSGNSTMDVYSTDYSGCYGIYVFSSGGTVNVYGGKFTATASHKYDDPAEELVGGDAIITSIDTGKYSYAKSSIIVKSGNSEFYGAIHKADNTTVELYGGKYDHDPSDYVAEGYVAEYDSETQLWTVVEDTPEVKITKEGQEDKTMSLASFRNKVNAGNSYAGYTVTLLDDVDLEGIEWTPIGTAEHPFSGVFDGDGKTIKNFKIETNCKNHGLFGYVKGETSVLGDGQGALDSYWSDGTKSFDYSSFESAGEYKTIIKNLTVEKAEIKETEFKAAAAVVCSAQHAYFYKINVKDSKIEGYKGAGGIAGSIGDCVINDCHVDNNTTVYASEYHGAGIVALNNNSSMYGTVYLANVILHCTNDANVSSVKGNIGGIIGSAQNGSVAVVDCINNGDISITGNGTQHIAGLIGGGNAGSYHQYLIDCINNGDVSGITSQYIAGALSYCAVKAVNVINNGNVTGTPDQSMAGIGAGSIDWSEYIDCANNGILTNNKPNGTTYDINDQFGTHVVVGVFADTAALNEYLAGITSQPNVELKCTVTDNTGTLVIPSSITSISSTNKVCSEIQLASGREKGISIGLPDITYEYDGGYTIWFNCPNSTITVPENITVPLISVSGEGSTVTIRGVVTGEVKVWNVAKVDNYGTIRYIWLRGHEDAAVEFNNYGTVGNRSLNTQSVSTSSKLNLTVNNHGSIIAAVDNYALLFYGNSTVVFNAYADSTITKADSKGVIAISNGPNAHARLVTINVAQGAAGVSGDAYYGAKASSSTVYECDLVINFNAVLPE